MLVDWIEREFRVGNKYAAILYMSFFFGYITAAYHANQITETPFVNKKKTYNEAYD